VARDHLDLGHVIRDRDTKFSGLFDTILRLQGKGVIPLPVRAPNLNAFAERWVQSIKQECLDHFIVVGESHLNFLVNEYVAHYTEEMPRQAKENLLLTGDWSAPPSEGPIRCRMRLGGLLNHYYRQAA